MARAGMGVAERIGQRAQSTLGRIEVLAFFPIIVLLADYLGFDNMAVVTAAGLAGLLACALVLPYRRRSAANTSPSQNGKDSLRDALEAVLESDRRDTVCLMLQIDDWPDVVETWGFDTAQDLSKRTEDRLRTTLRGGDVLCKIGDARFGIVLAAMPAARLGIRDTIAARLAEVVREPLHVTGATVRLSAGVGHSSLRLRAINQAEATIKAAEAALATALAQGPDSIQAYADGMGRAQNASSELGTEVEEAIHSGAIDAWFQPQVSAQTGDLTGMEIVPRWQHPKHGLLSYEEMQPALKASGHSQLMGQMMIHRAIEALSGFDTAQVHIPTISISISLGALCDPSLPDTITTEVERHKLTPDRIAFEITDDVAADRVEATVLDNLAALHGQGHRIDLAAASPNAVPLLALRAFSVGRIKIDPALSMEVDTNSKKGQVVGAIVAMAKVMDLQTLAAGVCTVSEQEHLAGLGCDHVQGFGIARPLRMDQIPEWMRARNPSDHSIDLPDLQAS